MTTRPEGRLRADDQIVNSVSRWLARHISDDDLRHEVEAVGTGELAPEQADAVGELLGELDAGGSRADVEMVARETLETLALGG